MEQLGSYYSKKYNIDFRSLRYPGFVSPYEYESHGTTDYACQIFFSALRKQEFKHYLSPEIKLPMIYLDDGIEGTIKFFEADEKRFTSRFYNLPGLSFTCKEITKILKDVFPDFKYKYEPDFRDDIARSCPEILDNSYSIKDWDWQPHTNTLEKLVKRTLIDIKKNPEYNHLFLNNFKIEDFLKDHSNSSGV
jgi:threonine 3-dehydrogenase